MLFMISIGLFNVLYAFSFSCLFDISSARTHVNYEVKGDVAVIRVNDPNAKVIVVFATTLIHSNDIVICHNVFFCNV